MNPRKLELQARAIVEEFLTRIGYTQPLLTLEITTTKLTNNELATIITNWPYNNAHITLQPQQPSTLQQTLLHECCHLLLAPFTDSGDKEEMVASWLETAFTRLLPKGWWKAAVRRANKCYKEQKVDGKSSPPKEKTLEGRTRQRRRPKRASAK